MRLRRKNHVIEAYRYTGTNLDEMKRILVERSTPWGYEEKRSVELRRGGEVVAKLEFYIQGSAGLEKVDAGDYLVFEGPSLYRAARQEIEDEYEEVTEEPMRQGGYEVNLPSWIGPEELTRAIHHLDRMTPGSMAAGVFRQILQQME